LYEDLIELLEIYLLPMIGYVHTLKKSVNQMIKDNENVENFLGSLIYSQNFNLPDGGFIELTMIIISIILKKLEYLENEFEQKKDQMIKTFDLILKYFLHFQEIWRHDDVNDNLKETIKVKYSKNMNIFNDSMISANFSQTLKRKYKSTSNFNTIQSNGINGNSQFSLLLWDQISPLTSSYSHPFSILCRSLEILSTILMTKNFDPSRIPTSFEDYWMLFESIVLENSDFPCQLAKFLMNQEKVESFKSMIRNFFLKKLPI
jgi:hypothetical protein